LYILWISYLGEVSQRSLIAPLAFRAVTLLVWIYRDLTAAVFCKLKA